MTLILLLPIALVGQAPTINTQTSTPGAVYGGVIQTPLLFEGETVPINQATLSLGVLGFYDDNVDTNNADRVADEAICFDPHLSVTRQTDRLVANFDYMPFFLLYRQVDQLDRINHVTTLNVTYRLSSRALLEFNEDFGYQNGNYAAVNPQTIISGLPSPTNPSQLVLPYTTRVLSSASGLGFTFVKSRRTSLTLAGGYSLVKYGYQTTGHPLYNSKGFSGSLTFQYGVTEHTNVGLVLVHQDTTYQAGQFFGYLVRSQIESAYVSLRSSLSPSVTLSLFGGPQYIGAIGEASAQTGVPAHFQGSGGGSITKELRNTALNLLLERSVGGSGGLYTSVISTNAAFGVRQRLGKGWEASFQAGGADEDASLFRLANGRTEGLFGTVAISRPLFRGSVFHVSYNSWHQVSKGTLPIISNFDRNQVSVGIDYQIKTLPFGR